MLLAPLALLLSVLAIPIILLYVLKLRRQEHVVPSTFLWQQVLEDVQANAPWQRLRFNLLLLLQLLVLAALILALARPAYSQSHVIAGDLVVIVDQSYGMQARDVRPSRFQAALARARTLQSELGSGNVMSVIGMGAQPDLAIAESGDGNAIRHAIDGLHASAVAPNFLEALSLAASLARAGASTHVVVLTSRDSGLATLPLRVNFPVDIERIGGNLRDLGITGFNASPGAAAVDAVATVTNFGAQTARSDLDLLADGRLVDVRPLVVGPRGHQTLVWSDIPAGTVRLQIRLTAVDDVSTDKSAWAAVAVEPPRRILLVSRGDFFLEAALSGDPALNVAVLPPRNYSAGLATGYDLVIFDNYLPASVPPAAMLLVAPPRSSFDGLRFLRNVAGGAVTPASGERLSSLLRYVDLSDVHVAQSRSVQLPGWMQVLATARGTPVLAAGQNGNVRAAAIGFDLQRSDWPLRVSFPIVLHNLLAYLAPGLTLGHTTIATGGSVTLLPRPGTPGLNVALPNGTADHLRPPFPPFTDTMQSGMYTVTSTGGGPRQTASFAVNFLPSRPVPAPGPATLHTGRVQTGKPLLASAPVGILWVFAGVALLLLQAEWWIAFRGARLP